MQFPEFEAFDAKLAKSHIRGQWKSEEFLHKAIGGPKPAGVPAIWKWADVTALLDEAGRVMPESLTARRSLIFQNPSLSRGTTQTINMGVQMIQPGETAWAHRHSISALRFVIQGHPALSTVVDGERCVMEDYDLVLTPNWSWHDHHNQSDRPAYWLDVLDVPLVLGLNQTFYEPFGEKEQVPHDRGPNAPVLRFPWRATEQALRQQAAQKGNLPQGAVYDYLNPATGGATMPTLQCRAQWLPAGFETRSLRRTSSAVYFVVRGEGVTEVDGQEVRWGKNDCFVVPNWTRHRHVNLSKTGEAVLFSVHDTPVLKALGLYREDAAERH
jgi:1-hydroxy-2-naphthoate dioxygenase